jgi:hypothetical protein
MSSNPPQGNVNLPKRVHAPLRRFYRGPKKQLLFVGQDPDEEIRLRVRKHPLFLVVPALPLIGSILFFFLVVWGGTRIPELGPIWTLLEIASGILILASALYFVYKDLILWWLNIDVITNKRILTWRGFLQQTRQVTPLEKVQQVAVDQQTFWSILFSYGLIHVYLPGGKGLELKDVPNPKEVRDAIEGIWEEFKTNKPQKPPLPKLQTQEVADEIAKLAEKEPLPVFADADAKWAHRRSSKGLRRPLRRFGWPFQIPCDVHYDAEEYSVDYIQRSRWVLAVKLVLPVFLLLATLLLALYFPALLPFSPVAFVILLIVVWLTVINYLDDVFIFTNKRIIDIERKFFFLFEQHDTTTYDKIRDIKVISHNVIELMLGIGDVLIETQGSDNPDIVMSHVGDPFRWQDRVYEIKDHKEKADKAKAKNDRKEELNEWFTKVLSQLERKIANRGVPNLQALDLWTAVERAGEFGMKVVPVGELSTYPHIESGKIVSQIPPPGTLIRIDPGKQEKPLIQVYLSKRN